MCVCVCVCVCVCPCVRVSARACVYVCMCVFCAPKHIFEGGARLIYNYPTHHLRAKCNKVNFKEVYIWSNSECFFPFTDYFTDTNERGQSNYLLRVNGRIDWLMPFSKVLARSEIQTALSRIWTRVIDYICKDDNRLYNVDFIIVSHTMGYVN